MIDRERIKGLLIYDDSGWPAATGPSAEELSELCRVYLAWLDAPSATVNQFGEVLIEGGSVSAGRLAGKRIRMVGVK